MRAALWLLAIFAVAVASALFAGNNDATVTVFWAPYRVDLSLNFLVLILLAAFALLYAAMRTLALMFALPKQAQHWRILQKERALNAHLFNAQSHFMAGRYIRARKSALAALSMDKALDDTPLDNALQLRSLAHVMVAQSAHALQDKEVRDTHLELALAHDNPKLAQETREGAQLLAAQWALDDHDAAGALRWLAGLPQGTARRIAALRLKLKAAQIENMSESALETTRLLAKHRAFSSTAAQSMVRSLVLAILNDARDAAQLQSAWRGLDVEERKLPDIAIHAASRLHVLGGDAQLVRAWLLPAWERLLVDGLAGGTRQHQSNLSDENSVLLVKTMQATLESMDDSWLAKIENAQRDNPRDSRLQYLAGMACKTRSLWGKAQQHLSLAAPRLSQPQDAVLQHQAWLALAELAEQRGDTQAAAHAWKKSAQVTH